MDARTWQIVKKWPAETVELREAQRAAFINIATLTRAHGLTPQ